VENNHKIAPSHTILLPAFTSGKRKKDIRRTCNIQRWQKALCALNLSNRLAEIDTESGKILRLWDVWCCATGGLY
jgi:hypothetical protein